MGSIYFTVDGGNHWTEVESDATISFRDLVIQTRENDVVAASFGRGFFVLDDYSPLREISEELLSESAHLFTPRTTKLYLERDVVGGAQGTNQYAADNPPYGATFTYYLRDSSKSLKEARVEREKETDPNEDIPFPGWDALDAELNEVVDQVHVVVRDVAGQVAGRIAGSTSKGLHRVTWDLEYPPIGVITPGNTDNNSGQYLATPGTYTASLVLIRDGEESILSGPVTFEVELLRAPVLEGKTPEEINEYRGRVASLIQRATLFSNSLTDHIELVEAMQTAHLHAPNPIY